MMKKAMKWIVLLIAMITLAKCGYDEIIYGDMTPKINPNPVKKVRIHGKFPFDKNVTLELRVGYINNNRKCNKIGKVFGIFPAVELKQKVYKVYKTTIKNGNYEAYFYQDYFLPGACEWKLGFVGLALLGDRIDYDANESIQEYIRFSQDKQTSHPINVTCNIHMSYWADGKPFQVLDCRLPKDKNYREGGIPDEGVSDYTHTQYNEVSYLQKNIELNFIKKGE